MDSGFIKIYLFLAVFGILFVWVFVGKPQISQNPPIPPQPQRAYALTATPVYTFPGSTEGWTAITACGASGATCQYQAGDTATADGSGSIEFVETRKNKSGTVTWDISVTWEDLGVPPGSTVTQVDGSYAYAMPVCVSCAGVNDSGDFLIRDSGDTTTIATLESGVALDTVTSWTTLDVAGAQAIGGGYQASNTSIILQITGTMGAGSSNPSSATVRHDDILLSITYTEPSNQPPEVSNVTLNNNGTITLNENTTITINATASTTDPNGADDIISATSTIYRSGVTAGCTADDNNCYKIGTGNCSFNGATTTVTCTANIQFFADPTDASSTAYSAEDWQAEITVTDSASATDASSTLSGVELNTLWAIDVTASISYGSVNPTEDTEGTNQTVTVTNTGNAAINVEASGTDMILSGSTIGVANQKYATSTFTYSSCTVCTALSSTPTAYEVDLLKPTSATQVTDLIYWGLLVPDGTAQGAHSGINTFTAIGD